MKIKIICFVLSVLWISGQLWAEKLHLEVDALDGTYDQRCVRVTETNDGYEVSIDAFHAAPGVYFIKFSKEQCVIDFSEHFEEINCLIDSKSYSSLPMFLQRRGVDKAERVESDTDIVFSLDRFFVNLQMAGQTIRFSIQQILSYKLLDRTQLVFPKYLF